MRITHLIDKEFYFVEIEIDGKKYTEQWNLENGEFIRNKGFDNFEEIPIIRDTLWDGLLWLEEAIEDMILNEKR